MYKNKIKDLENIDSNEMGIQTDKIEEDKKGNEMGIQTDKIEEDKKVMK